jgi:hypothetical protein
MDHPVGESLAEILKMVILILIANDGKGKKEGELVHSHDPVFHINYSHMESPHGEIPFFCITKDLLAERSRFRLFLESYYDDYPAGWARALYKILCNYEALPPEWFDQICIAIGKLRESLGSKIPKLLLKASKDNQLSEPLRNRAAKTKKLFSREHSHNIRLLPAKRRVMEAKDTIIRAYYKSRRAKTTA